MFLFFIECFFFSISSSSFLISIYLRVYISVFVFLRALVMNAVNLWVVSSLVDFLREKHHFNARRDCLTCSAFFCFLVFCIAEIREFPSNLIISNEKPRLFSSIDPWL